MGGGGSIQGMITSLNNNRKLLRKKRLFRPEKTFFGIKNEYIKSAGGELMLKKATKKQLRDIRVKILKRRKRIEFVRSLVFIVFISLFCLMAFNYIQSSKEVNERNQKIEFKLKTDQYYSLIADGDEWLKTRKWHNAIFQYKKALAIFPSDYSIHYRLANAYCLRCEDEFKDCNKGKKILDKLLHQFPNKPELLKLKKKLEYEY